MKKIILAILCTLALMGVIGVYSVGGMVGAYTWSLFIFILAPVAVLAVIIQLVVLIGRLIKKQIIKWNIIFLLVSLVFTYHITILMGISPITYPTNADESESVQAIIPVEDAVLFGGKEYKTHAIWPSECYAYDILAKPYDVGSEELEDYGIYGRDVVAPVSGTIIDMVNTEIDIVPNTEEFTSSLGNYVFIQIDETNTYMILAHFQQGSISVSIGDHVTQGTMIGKVGNSGTTSEPHLHMQHQRNNPLTMIYPTCAEGLPIIFKE